MGKLLLAWAALPLAAVLCHGSANAQSSGPTHRMQDELNALRGEIVPDSDAATSRAELESFFKRLPGRFRIEGQIEQSHGIRKLTGRITGIADCSGVGEGPGVHCILNATWPVIDRKVADIAHGAKESPSEMLNTFRPAVLVLGVDSGSVRGRALLITADSFSHGWLGSLDGNTLKGARVVGCKEEDVRCFRSFQITADPEGESVTLLLLTGLIDISFSLHRDADARADKKMKSLKAR